MKSVLHTLMLVLGLVFAFSAHALVEGAELTSTRFFNLTHDQYVYGYTDDGRINMRGDFCRIEVAGLAPNGTYGVNPGTKFKVTAKNSYQFNLSDEVATGPLLTVTCFTIRGGQPEYVSLAALTSEHLKKILGLE